MFAMVIIGIVIGLVAALIGSMIALGIQRRSFVKTLLEHEAWERAQESQQHSWEAQQEKRTLTLEHRLATEIEQIQAEWQAWQAKDAARIEALSQQYAEMSAKLNLDKDLARLPHIDEAPLPPSSYGQGKQRRSQAATWQPPSFFRADLSGRDLSERYLGPVDLREAQLVGANFYMADLTGACLAGANLSHANLSGANLSGADLRNAILSDANLLVTDLHNTVLIGADLRGAHRLTAQQVYAAIYDSTTQLDPKVDLTQPRTRGISSPLSASTPPQPSPAIEVEEGNFTTEKIAAVSAGPVIDEPQSVGSLDNPEPAIEEVATVPGEAVIDNPEPTGNPEKHGPTIYEIATLPIEPVTDEPESASDFGSAIEDTAIVPGESVTSESELAGNYDNPEPIIEDTATASSEPDLVRDAPPETAQPGNIPETTVEQQELEPLPSSPPPLDGNQQAMEEADPPANRPGNKQIAKPGKATPKQKYSGKRRAKVN
jgi:Pentapeptide repeats (8 copies)